jgi:tryptophan halogenase
MHPRKVLIVGGGAAGWMTALQLDATLNRDGRKFVDVAVLELPVAPPRGAGESTLASINHVLAVIGVDQVEFMRRVGGTFKQSTRFVNWLGNDGHSSHHPFSVERTGTVDRAGRHWLRSNRSIPFAETVSAQPGLCEMNLAPLMLGRWDFGPPLPFAYHLDTARLAEYLHELSAAKGIVCHAEDIARIDMTEAGNIAAIVTGGGNRLDADLFVDCSGSAALLIGKQMGVDWHDCSRWVLCDRSATMQVPYDVHYPGVVRPYTTATALSAGWVCEIPLRDRRSLSYVFSGHFIDHQQAENELRGFEGSHSDALSIDASGFATGHRENAWTGNCIAIGSASSHIEPLESTDLYMSSLAAAMLAEHFPYGDELAPLAFRFNRIMTNRFYEILDFVNLHYCLTRRTDSDFWNEVRRPARINDRLQAKLEFWRRKPPSRSDFEDQFFPGQPDAAMPSSGWPGDHRSPVDTAGLWGYENYEMLLYGMDFLHEECDDWFGPDRPDPTVPGTIAERLAMAPQKLPPQDLWLKQVFGMPDYPPSPRGTR